MRKLISSTDIFKVRKTRSMIAMRPADDCELAKSDAIHRRQRTDQRSKFMSDKPNPEWLLRRLNCTLPRILETFRDHAEVAVARVNELLPDDRKEFPFELIARSEHFSVAGYPIGREEPPPHRLTCLSLSITLQTYSPLACSSYAADHNRPGNQRLPSIS